MEQPKLPFWFYSGRASAPIDGPVYVMKDNGEIVGGSGPSVLVPRTKFFATAQATSHLASRGLVKRLADPKPAKAEEKPVEPPKEVATKVVSTKSVVEPIETQPEPVASSEPEASDGVIASDAGEGEAGSSSTSVPEEKERSLGRSSRERLRDRR